MPSVHKTVIVHVERAPKESSDRLIQRFTKKVQASRILTQIREQRYRRKPLTKRLARKRAIMREYYRSLREKKKHTA